MVDENDAHINDEPSKYQKFGDLSKFLRRYGQRVADGKVLIDVKALDAQLRDEDDRVRFDLDALEADFENEIRNDELPNRPIAQGRKLPVRNPPVAPPWVKIDGVRWQGSTFRSGKTVEMRDGHFLHIADVIENLQTDELKLRGWELRRSSEMDGILRKSLNELCFIFEVELDDPRSVWDQSAIEVDIHDVVKIRHLIRTNRPYAHYKLTFPDVSEGDLKTNKQHARENEALFARWKYTVKYENRAQRLKSSMFDTHVKQRTLEVLAEEDCSEGYHIDPVLSRYLWRGETLLGGSDVKEKGEPRRASTQSTSSMESTQRRMLDALEFCPRCGDSFQRVEWLVAHYRKLHEPRRPSSENQGDIRPSDARRTWGSSDSSGTSSSNTSGPQSRNGLRNEKAVEDDVDDLPGHLAAALNLDAPPQDRTYTYGDTFCGAGGTTRGALLANLKILWGLDMDSNSGKTWRKNFPMAKHYEMWAHEFVTLPDELQQLYVDILHLSPPCQVWSPVHTVEGKDDQQNFSSLFACEELLKKARPRMVTLEQTFGILHPKFSQAFNALVQMFTFYGYSISWQLVEFQRWGLAQSRRRLIIVAAGPGETIPEIPRYTHSDLPDTRLKHFTSVNSVLSRIPRHAANHDVDRMLSKRNIKEPWNGNGLANTITCGGGGKGHPSGLRNFTHREFASLQSFPLNHVFFGYKVRKQIGNAVPPLIAKILFRAIVKHLEKVDGVVHDVQVIE